MAYAGSLAKELVKAYFKGGNAQGQSSPALKDILNVIIQKAAEIAADERRQE